MFFFVKDLFYETHVSPCDIDLPPGPVKAFDMNTLQSNNPIEDAHSEVPMYSLVLYLQANTRLECVRGGMRDAAPAPVQCFF